MSQQETLRRARYARTLSESEPSVAGLVGFGTLLLAAAWIGWQFGCWAFEWLYHS